MYLDAEKNNNGVHAELISELENNFNFMKIVPF